METGTENGEGRRKKEEKAKEGWTGVKQKERKERHSEHFLIEFLGHHVLYCCGESGDLLRS